MGGDQSEDPSGECDVSDQHLVFSWVRGSLTLIGEKGVVPERVDVIHEDNWVRWIRPRPVGAECKWSSIARDPPLVVVCTGTSPIVTPPLPGQVSLLCLSNFNCDQASPFLQDSPWILHTYVLGTSILCCQTRVPSECRLLECH